MVMATLFMLVKLIHSRAGVSLPELMFWRQAGTAIILLCWLVPRGQLGQLRSDRLRAHAARSISGTIGMIANFGAAILLPLAVSTVLGFSTPMFAVVLSAVFLAERVGRWRWLSVALGFAGVLIIARPGAMPVSPLGALAGLGSGFMIALISIQLRDLGRTERPTAVVFWFAAFGSLMLAPILPFVMTAHSPLTWAALAGVGVVGATTHMLLTASLRYGAVSSVIVMDYTVLIWSTLYSEYVFHQSPPANTWIGAPLVVVAGLIIAWREHRRHHDSLLEAQAEAR